MEFVIKIGQFLLSLSLLIVLHELGHFIPAKLFKTRVEKFYLFFDIKYSLFKKKIGDTVYGIGWLPLGGYVKISGMIDESMDKEQMAQPPQPWEFRSKPSWQRLIIMLGGVTVNFILAYVIYVFLSFTYGDKDTNVNSLKDGYWIESPTLNDIGFKTGDKVLAINDNPIIKDSDIGKNIISAKTITIERDNAEKTIALPEDFLGQLSTRQKRGLFEFRIPFMIGEVADSSVNKSVDLKKGDILVSFNGEELKYYYQLEARKKDLKNASIEVEILRGENTLERTLKTNERAELGIRPAYDDAQEIYMDMLNELEEGVAQIGSGNSLGTSDLVFGGDNSKWKKFGNSLMLRLASRIKNVDPSASNAWALKAINGGTMSSNADTAFMIHTDGPTDLNRNAWGTYAPRYPNARIGATLYDWLADHGDPRLNILADPNGPAAGNRYGLENDQLAALYGESPASYASVNPMITQKNSPWVFLSYAQTALLEAEFAASAGDHSTAETKYNSGVMAHMQSWGTLYDPSLSVDDSAVSAYLSSNPYTASQGEAMIGEQYWAASFFDFFEGFSNFRRSGFPELQPFGGESPHHNNTTNGQIPRRLIYPASEASVNADNYQAVIQSQGPNDQVTRVWWDVN